MIRSVRDLLRCASPGSDEARQVAPFLKWPFCIPGEPGLQEKARALLGDGLETQRLAPGETLLLATAGAEASLWVLRPSRDASSEGELDRSCREELLRASGLVSRYVPIIGVPTTVIEWSVEPIAANGQAILRGASFHLSFYLAVSSWLLQVALPPDVAASATVQSDGSLGEVDSPALERKLRAVMALTPGVRRFLVHAKQLGACRRIAADFDHAPAIVGVESLEQALEAAFNGTDLVASASRGWSDRGRRFEAVQRTFRHALDDRASLVDYAGLARAAEILSTYYEADCEEARQLQFARIVAQGHDGAEGSLPLDTGWLEGMRRPVRLRLLANIVMRALYTAADARREVLDYAESVLRTDPHDDSVDDLKVWGALGRLYAPLGQYARARHCLRRAVTGWEELGEWGGISRPLCELLRVDGVTQRSSSVEELVKTAVRRALASGELSAGDRAFVVFSVARAFELLGDSSRALHYLQGQAQLYEIDWHRVPRHLQASALRCEASAYEQASEGAKAASCREELRRLAEGDEKAIFAWLLSRLDRMLRTAAAPEELESVLREFASGEGKAYDLAVGLSASDGSCDRARALVRHYPY